MTPITNAATGAAPGVQPRPLAVGDQVRFIGPTLAGRPDLLGLAIGQVGIVVFVDPDGTQSGLFDPCTVGVDWGLVNDCWHQLSTTTGNVLAANTGLWVRETELEMVLPATPPTSPPPRTTPPRLRIRLTRTGAEITPEAAYRVLDANIGAELKALLPPQYRRAWQLTLRNTRYRDGHRLIAELLDSGEIPIDVLTDALKELIIRRMGITEAYAEYTDDAIDNLLQGQPPLMAVGTRIYQLRPIAVAEHGRALGLIRERIVKASRQEAESLKVAAQREADNLIAQAQRKVESLKAEMERMAEGKALIIPEWLLERRTIPLRVNVCIDTARPERGFPLRIGFVVPAQVATFEYNTGELVYKWTARPRQHDANVIVWVPWNPLSGKYDYHRGCVMEGYALPHVSSRSCGEIQGLPPELKNYTQYSVILAAFKRFTSSVNLASLLAGWSAWHPAIQEQIPPTLRTYLTSGRGHTSLPPEPIRGEVTITSIHDEAAGVFNLEDLERRR